MTDAPTSTPADGTAAQPDPVVGALAAVTGALAGGGEERPGQGVPELVDHLVGRLPEGPLWYPEDQVRDSSEAFWVAELVREQLLATAREELPHSIATRCVELNWPYIEVEILVERISQKGMVIGQGGENLKRAGIGARKLLPKGTHLELKVKVNRDWQRKDAELDKLGY